jgi:hypothetical protein
LDKFSHTKRPQDTVPKDYNDIKDGLLYLLTVADENWKALETNPEGTSDFIEHTAKNEWALDVAANYKIFIKYFVIRNKDDNLSSQLCSLYPKTGTQ